MAALLLHGVLLAPRVKCRSLSSERGPVCRGLPLAPVSRLFPIGSLPDCVSKSTTGPCVWGFTIGSVFRGLPLAPVSLVFPLVPLWV